MNNKELADRIAQDVMRASRIKINFGGYNRAALQSDIADVILTALNTHRSPIQMASVTPSYPQIEPGIDY